MGIAPWAERGYDGVNGVEGCVLPLGYELELTARDLRGYLTIFKNEKS